MYTCVLYPIEARGHYFSKHIWFGNKTANVHYSLIVANFWGIAKYWLTVHKLSTRAKERQRERSSFLLHFIALKHMVFYKKIVYNKYFEQYVQMKFLKKLNWLLDPQCFFFKSQHLLEHGHWFIKKYWMLFSTKYLSSTFLSFWQAASKCQKLIKRRLWFGYFHPNLWQVIAEQKAASSAETERWRKDFIINTAWIFHGPQNRAYDVCKAMGTT